MAHVVKEGGVIQEVPCLFLEVVEIVSGLSLGESRLDLSFVRNTFGTLEDLIKNILDELQLR